MVLKKKNDNEYSEEESKDELSPMVAELANYSGHNESQFEPPFGVTFQNFNFSDSLSDLCKIIGICINKEIKNVVFESCRFPFLSERRLEKVKFKTPSYQMRPLYGISFIRCKYHGPLLTFQEDKIEWMASKVLNKKGIEGPYDKADQIGLLLNCPGLPFPLRENEETQEIEGGISSITFKNNGFTEVEMAKLKVYLCYAENLMIYEED